MKTHLSMLLAGHIIAVVVEVLMYNFVISMFVTELVLAYLCLYAYMKFTSPLIYLYIALLGINVVFGVFSLFSVGGWFLIYIGQLAAFGYGDYFLVLKFQAYQRAKTEDRLASKYDKTAPSED